MTIKFTGRGGGCLQYQNLKVVLALRIFILSSFNLALLGKAAWKIMNNQDSLSATL